jgi:hypothetical protein
MGVSAYDEGWVDRVGEESKTDERNRAGLEALGPDWIGTEDNLGKVVAA